MTDGFAAQPGGAMRMEGAPGRGTTVSFWLPRTAAGAEPGEPAPGRDATRRRRAPVVGDVPVMRRFFCDCLRHAGWDAAEAGHTEDALALLETAERFGLLVMGLVMPPGPDGGALIRDARARRPGLPAVLVTGSEAPPGLAVAAGREGFTLLRTPVSPAELTGILAALA